MGGRNVRSHDNGPFTTDIRLIGRTINSGVDVAVKRHRRWWSPVEQARDTARYAVMRTSCRARVVARRPRSRRSKYVHVSAVQTANAAGARRYSPPCVVSAR